MSAQATVKNVMDPTTLTLAGMYAEAALGLLPSDAQAEQAAEELASIAEMMEREDSSGLLGSVLVSQDERQRIVRRAFDGKCSQAVMGLLDVLARNGRLGVLGLVARAFRKQLNTRQGKVDVLVTAATELDSDIRSQLEAVLRETMGIIPLLHVSVDPSVLGGLTVKVGDKVFDATIATQLSRLRRTLAERRRT